MLSRALEELRRERERIVAVLGVGVVSFGVGSRVRRQKRRRTLAIDGGELVVRVIVERKRGAKWLAKATRADVVPPFIEVAVQPPSGGGRVPYAIPTDTCQRLMRVRAHAGGGKQDLRAQGVGGVQFVDGTACCLLRRDEAGDDRRYVLGCHHVIRRSDLTSDASPLDPDEVLADGVPVGAVTGDAPFGEGEPDSIDAALIRLSSAGIRVAAQASYWRVAPTIPVASREELLGLGAGTFSLFPRCFLSGNGPLDRTRLEFHGLEDRFRIKYEGGGSVTIEEVALFEPIDDAPIAGYSGAPVVIGGRFVGMHIAGGVLVDDDGNEVRRTAAIPAYVLLRKGLLVGGSALRLASPTGVPTTSC